MHVLKFFCLINSLANLCSRCSEKVWDVLLLQNRIEITTAVKIHIHVPVNILFLQKGLNPYSIKNSYIGWKAGTGPISLSPRTEDFHHPSTSWSLIPGASAVGTLLVVSRSACLRQRSRGHMRVGHLSARAAGATVSNTCTHQQPICRLTLS